MGDAGKFPAVAFTVASAADPVADAVAFPAVVLAIPTVAVMGDAGKIPVMASAVVSVVDAVAISAVASAIPTAVVGWDAGKIPMVAWQHTRRWMRRQFPQRHRQFTRGRLWGTHP